MVSVTVPVCVPALVGVKVTGMAWFSPVAPTVVGVTVKFGSVHVPVTC